jgi:hypothetical protein
MPHKGLILFSWPYLLEMDLHLRDLRHLLELSAEGSDAHFPLTTPL